MMNLNLIPCDYKIKFVHDTVYDYNRIQCYLNTQFKNTIRFCYIEEYFNRFVRYNHLDFVIFCLDVYQLLFFDIETN